MANTTTMKARAATLNELIANTVPDFLQPVPCKDTLRNWFDRAGIPRLKASPRAKRGGGQVYYSVPHVKKLMKTRFIPNCHTFTG